MGKTTGKVFNVNGDCKPGLHYMVALNGRLEKIRDMVDQGLYFTINRARQYGKTTILRALGRFLEEDYVVISIDFQMLGHANFASECIFAAAFCVELLDSVEGIPQEIRESLKELAKGEGSGRQVTLFSLFKVLSRWCRVSEKGIVLLIDEVDSAANNQVFLDFLAQLRGYYINRDRKPAFQSVILAGVYDIKNMKRKIRPEEGHRMNSPWNIAADFLVDMSFSVNDICGMLNAYKQDHSVEMDSKEIAELLFAFTSGYPVLVSQLCKLMDERVPQKEGFRDSARAWTRDGFLEAVKMLLGEKNSLFESLAGKLEDFPELKHMLYLLLFQGRRIVYNPDDQAVDTAMMFGFVKVMDGAVVVANRIFETRLYNMFLTLPDVQNLDVYQAACRDQNQFIQNGHLNMKRVLEKFVVFFDDVYGDRGETFYEEDGRRYFMLYLRPIINGNGNYYIEARTRNMERTDLIIDYNREQFIVELKLWRGEARHREGEKQLAAYLEHYHLTRGYMLSFNFNKKKKIGVKEVSLGDKVFVEAVV